MRNGTEDGTATGPVLPIWVQPITRVSWPTQLVESSPLRYSTQVREGWTRIPETSSTDMEVTHTYRGPSQADWLIVSFMDRANNQGDMHNWVDAILALVGFPVLEMTVGAPAPRLLDWRCDGQFDTLTKRLGMHETLLYSGMAALPGEPGQPPTLAHLYILVARRSNFAWKVILSLQSACLPTMPEEVIAANDHVRAGATFGAVRLL